MQISELKFMIREIKNHKGKVESYDKLCSMFTKLEARVNGLKNNTSVKIFKVVPKEGDKKDEDIVKIVKLHARYNGVRVMSALVIHNRFDDGHTRDD